jgi:hypothetical protein
MTLEVLDLGEGTITVCAHSLLALRPSGDVGHVWHTLRRTAVCWPHGWIGLDWSGPLID